MAFKRKRPSPTNSEIYIEAVRHFNGKIFTADDLKRFSMLRYGKDITQNLHSVKRCVRYRSLRQKRQRTLLSGSQIIYRSLKNCVRIPYEKPKRKEVFSRKKTFSVKIEKCGPKDSTMSISNWVTSPHSNITMKERLHKFPTEWITEPVHDKNDEEIELGNDRRLTQGKDKRDTLEMIRGDSDEIIETFPAPLAVNVQEVTNDEQSKKSLLKDNISHLQHFLNSMDNGLPVLKNDLSFKKISKSKHSITEHTNRSHQMASPHIAQEVPKSLMEPKQHGIPRPQESREHDRVINSKQNHVISHGELSNKKSVGTESTDLKQLNNRNNESQKPKRRNLVQNLFNGRPAVSERMHVFVIPREESQTRSAGLAMLKKVKEENMKLRLASWRKIKIASGRIGKDHSRGYVIGASTSSPIIRSANFKCNRIGDRSDVNPPCHHNEPSTLKSTGNQAPIACINQKEKTGNNLDVNPSSPNKEPCTSNAAGSNTPQMHLKPEVVVEQFPQREKQMNNITKDFD